MLSSLKTKEMTYWVKFLSCKHGYLRSEFMQESRFTGTLNKLKAGEVEAGRSPGITGLA